MWKTVRRTSFVFTRKTILLLSTIRLVPHITFMLFSSNRDVIWSDLDSWSRGFNREKPRNLTERVFFFVSLMSEFREYCNVFYIRIGRYAVILAFFAVQCQH